MRGFVQAGRQSAKRRRHLIRAQKRAYSRCRRSKYVRATVFMQVSASCAIPGDLLETQRSFLHEADLTCVTDTVKSIAPYVRSRQLIV